MVQAATLRAWATYVLQVASRTSTCVPPGMVVASAASSLFTPHLSLSLHAFNGSLETCVRARVAVFCTDRDIMHASRAWSSPCFDGTTAAPATPTEAFADLVWLKWHLIASSLTTARAVFFIDADTLLFRNPFRYVGLDTDVAFQHARRPSKNAQWPDHLASASQILVRNRSLATQLVALQEGAGDSLSGELVVAWVQREWARAGMRVQYLHRWFAGHCWARRFGSEAACMWVSYQAQCAGELPEVKARILRDARGRRDACVAAKRAARKAPRVRQLSR